MVPVVTQLFTTTPLTCLPPTHAPVSDSHFWFHCLLVCGNTDTMQNTSKAACKQRQHTTSHTLPTHLPNQPAKTHCKTPSKTDTNMTMQAGATQQAGASQQASDTSGVYEASGLDPRQRWWHVLDNALILPEYIAEVACGPTAGKASMIASHRAFPCQHSCTEGYCCRLLLLPFPAFVQFVLHQNMP